MAEVNCALSGIIYLFFVGYTKCKNEKIKSILSNITFGRRLTNDLIDYYQKVERSAQ